MIPIASHAIASLVPAGLILAGATVGGAWGWAILGYMTVYVWVLDRMNVTLKPREDLERVARVYSVLLALVHFAVMPAAVWALAAGAFNWPQALAFWAGTGLFLGQVSNSNAHELIHRPGRAERGLGVLVYVTLLYAQHVPAHLLVHHVHVATDRDPNSAALGHGFWSFALRAWLGELRAGYLAEARRRPGLRHPYLRYTLGEVGVVMMAAALAGWAGVAALLALAGYAQIQLLLADYIQHYGLRRKARADGRTEPTGPAHSWNAPHWYSAAMMLNAPRHSDHHTNPGRIYSALRLEADMPRWPYSMPVMATIALIPPLWRRVMDRRVRRVMEGLGGGRPDLSHSSHAEPRHDSVAAVGPAGVGGRADVGGSL
ncbi:alkane 1-monooxygenase [Lutimaribacter marinistellae]|uniref:Alkane 1-monooxygenase n=2 Tax=Lutimaribacter marinistellae TaxID=1820329 RepID=A0ABV7TL84_9RHOB